MSVRNFESGVRDEIRQITGRKNLRVKDIMEWSTSEEVVRKNAVEGKEIVIHCKQMGVWAAILKESK